MVTLGSDQPFAAVVTNGGRGPQRAAEGRNYQLRKIDKTQ